MRGKSLLAFALAIACGLVAMVGVQQVLRKQTGNPDADKVTVFVAATEILPGTTIDVTMLEKRKFLKGSVPKEAVIDLKQLENRALTCKVMPGDIIRIDKLGAEGKTGASISIPAGMRVVSLPTNTTQAHSGMLQAGDRVDVMVSYRVQPPSGGGRDYPETKTILGYIQVFATDAVRDSNAPPADGGKVAAMKNVSLLVTPEQAQVLMMAQSVGTLHLSLRNAGDMKEVEIANLTPDEFRDQVVLNGHPMDEPDPTKQNQLQPPYEGEPANDLNNFLDDAAGKSTQVAAAPAPESNTESWDIAFYSRTGVTVETLEIPRREVPVKAAAEDQGASSVVNSLFKMLQPANESKAEKKSGAEAKPQGATGGPDVSKNSKQKTSGNKTTRTTKTTKQLPSKAVTSSLAK